MVGRLFMKFRVSGGGREHYFVKFEQIARSHDLQKGRSNIHSSRAASKADRME